jgi:hypothetical protein
LVNLYRTALATTSDYCKARAVERYVVSADIYIYKYINTKDKQVNAKGEVVLYRFLVRYKKDYSSRSDSANVQMKDLKELLYANIEFLSDLYRLD